MESNSIQTSQCNINITRSYRRLSPQFCIVLSSWTRTGLPLVFILLSLACQVNLAEVGKPTGPGVTVLPATPPPAPVPEGEKLYQMLYAGEFGDGATPAGQRLRILAWAAYVGFDNAQLQALLALSDTVQKIEAEGERDLTLLGESEKTALTPVYQDLIGSYANQGIPSKEQLQAKATVLENARKEAYGGTDPRGAHYQNVVKALKKIHNWVETLPGDQQTRLGACRFFLQRRLGPFTNPGDYGLWLGTAWSGANFASLKTEGRPVDEGQMDIGGLWSADEVTNSPETSLHGLRVSVLLLFAIESPGFVEALQVRMGSRAADAY